MNLYFYKKIKVSKSINLDLVWSKICDSPFSSAFALKIHYLELNSFYIFPQGVLWKQIEMIKDHYKYTGNITERDKSTA